MQFGAGLTDGISLTDGRARQKAARACAAGTRRRSREGASDERRRRRLNTQQNTERE